MASANYADGTVHELTQGSVEFQPILASAASQNQLVLLDFSASWCGPCRMLAPVLQQLAREHQGRLVCVKMDCEKTSANQNFSAESGITAFPTLHLYRAQHGVTVLRGANPAALRQAIDQQLGFLGGASGSGANTGAHMALNLAKELAKIKSSCSQDEFISAAKTLVTFISNILNNPRESKYRRVKVNNPTFHYKLGSKSGGKGCMAALGFKEFMEAGEGVMVMDHIDPALSTVKMQLEDAISRATTSSLEASRAPIIPIGAGASPASAPETTAAPAGGVGTTDNAANVVVLAQSLARALAAGSPGAGSGSVLPRNHVAAEGGGGQRQEHRGRQVVVTPAKLARYLERILIGGGLGRGLAQQQ